MRRGVPSGAVLGAIALMGFGVAGERAELLAHSASRDRSHPVSLADLVGLRWVRRGLALAPDGTLLAYVSGGERVADSVWVTGTKPGSVPRALGPGKMPRWAPEGRRLAFYSARTGSLQLWLYDADVGSVRVVTRMPAGINPSAPLSGHIDEPLTYTWSGDGAQIAFTSEVAIPDPEQGKQASIELPVRIGAPAVFDRNAPLDAAMRGVFVASVGNRFVNGRFTGLDATPWARSRRAVNQVFVVELASGRLRQLTADTAGYFYPAWAPSGHTIAATSPEGRVSRAHLPDTTNIYLLNEQTGGATRLTSGPGLKRLPAWSGDGSTVAYVTRSQMFGLQAVMVVPANGGAPSNVTERLDRQVENFHFTPDGRSILTIVPDGVARPLVRIDLASQRAEPLTPPGAVVSDVAVSRSGLLAWVSNDVRHYQLISVVVAPGDSARALVDLNPQTATWELGDQRVVRWKTAGGDTLDGVLILPIGYRPGTRYPLVVDGYGGHTNSLQTSVINANQTLAARGYVVFLPNHRGPHIYQNYQSWGRVYTDKGKGPQGIAVLVDDILSGVDTLIAQGLADSTRLALFGYSNGGGAVNYMITRTTRFRCAISAAPAVTDRAADFFLLGDPSYPLFWDEGYTPWERPDLYAAVSPVYHLDRVHTPLLLAVGDRDTAFLLGTLEMYRGLRWLHRDVTLLRYRDQSHELEGAALEDLWNRVYAFLDDHLTRNAGMATPQ